MQTPKTTREAIAELGGIERTAALIGRTHATIRNWQASGTVSPEAEARFLALTERHGIYWRPAWWDPRLQLRWNPKVTQQAA